MTEPHTTIASGIVGTAASLAGLAVSLLAVEPWLRVGSLTLGIVVALLTIRKLLK